MTSSEIGLRLLLAFTLTGTLAACGNGGGEPAEPALTAADLGEQTIMTAAEWLASDPYSAADLDAGRGQARVCLACHSLNEGGPNMIGPNLYGFFGSGVGSVDNYSYSAAIEAADFVWTPRALDAWLRQPADFLPGNRMVFAGVPGEADRRDLIAFLLAATSGDTE